MQLEYNNLIYGNSTRIILLSTFSHEQMIFTTKVGRGHERRARIHKTENQQEKGSGNARVMIRRTIVATAEQQAYSENKPGWSRRRKCS